MIGKLVKQLAKSGPTQIKKLEGKALKSVLGKAGSLDKRGRVEPFNIPSLRPMREIELGPLGSQKQSQVHLKRPKELGGPYTAKPTKPAATKPTKPTKPVATKPISDIDRENERLRTQKPNRYGGGKADERAALADFNANRQQLAKMKPGSPGYSTLKQKTEYLDRKYGFSRKGY